MSPFSNLLRNYWIFHVNAFYAMAYFLKHNLIFIGVLGAVGYLLCQELEQAKARYVDDQRRII